MHPDEVRNILEDQTLTVPYEIRTRGGKSYRVEDHTSIFLPAAYPDTVVIVRPRKGLAWIGLGSIDSVHFEHES